jgi:hypothetical protein
MRKKPAAKHRDAVTALRAIEDPVERAQAAGELMQAIRETTPDIVGVRQEAIKELRARPLSYRTIGDLLGIHFTRVKQIETGEPTRGWKKPATKPDDG